MTHEIRGPQGQSGSRIDDLLVIDEVAALLRCSTKTIRRHIAAGRIPALKGPGGHFLVDRRVLLASLQPTAPGALSTELAPPPSRPEVIADMASDLTT